MKYKGAFRTCFIVLILSCVIPFCSFAGEKSVSIYTIQIASFSTLMKADEEFNLTAQSLGRDNLAYLRIEKIGDFYSLRLGKFNNNMEAMRFLESIKTGLPSSMIVNAYFKEERIVRLYGPDKETHPETASAAETDTGEKNVADNTADIDKIIASISSLAHNKDYDNALKITKKMILKNPGHSLLNAWHGTLLLKTDRAAEALSYIEKAVALSPDVPDYHNSLGYCFFYLNKPDRAIRAFDKALSLEPGHIDALAGLGIIYAKNGNKDRAMNIYGSLKNLDAVSADKLLRLVRK